MSLLPLWTPTSSRLFFGFDVETEVIDGKHDFVCASIVNHEIGYRKTFRSPIDTMIEIRRLCHKHGCTFVCTNMEFDVMQLLRHCDKERQSMRLILRKSRWIAVKIPLRVTTERGRKHPHTHYITFIDTLNFFPRSVSWLGENLLKLPKLSTEVMGRQPKDEREWLELQRYNQRDAEITQRTMQMLQEMFCSLHTYLPIFRDKISKETTLRIEILKGFECRNTMASTAYDCFRRLFLSDEMMTHQPAVFDDIFSAYYGGRTECFRRGRLRSDEHTQYVAFDVNSMYPFVMRERDFPDPNSLMTIGDMTEDLLHLEGVCYAELETPGHWLPYLPFRQEKKLLFPNGNIKGWYTTFQIRTALTYGYKIKKLGRAQLYKKTCKPFKEYIDMWYALRQHFAELGDPREELCKLAMNGLYGRFALKPDIERKVIHQDDLTMPEIIRYQGRGWNVHKPSEESEFFYVENPNTAYADDIVPIWSVYVTAYAQHVLYEYMLTAQDTLIYVDTDALTCAYPFPADKKLGALKKEKIIQEAIFIRPKMYGYRGIDNREKNVIKGLKHTKDNQSLRWMETMVVEKKAVMERWMRFFGAQRPLDGRMHQYGEIISVVKNFDLDDTKRAWPGGFALENGLETSEPLVIT